MTPIPFRPAAVCVLLGLAAGAPACGRHEPTQAVGPNDEISVLTNTDPEGLVAGEVRNLLAYPVEVMGKEDAFRLDFVPFPRFGVHRYVKNQAFAVDLSKDDDLAKAFPGMVPPAVHERIEAREPFMILVRDLWATGQTTLITAAWSYQDLLDLLRDADAEAWRRRYENAVVDGLIKTMFSLGEDTVIPTEVARKFGWTLRLTTGFHAADHPEGNFVKFNSENPVRLILVHWVDREVPLVEDAWEPIMARMLDVYDDGDFVLKERTRTFPDTFQDAPALKWEGIWQNDKYVIGGPFRAFAFHRGGVSYLLTGIVFAPGQDKVYALRQVEALMKTFRLVQ